MMEKVEKGVGLLGKLLNLQKKYGFFSILKSLFILLLLGYVIFFALNPTYLLERITTIQDEKHTEAITKRIKSDEEIRLLLEKMRLKTKSDRAWMIEFHNGSNNISTGLPFLFGSMRLETTSDTIPGVEEEYVDFSLSRYPLLMCVLSNGYFYGNLEDMKEHDQKLYYKMKSNGVNETAMLTLYNGDSPMGIVGLSFCNQNTMDEKCVGMEIRRTGVKIASLLMP